MDTKIPKHNVVLLGVGHTHAHIVRMWRMKPIPDASLLCITNHPIATYSGMLPGVLAGQYPPERMEIDLVRLCAAVGARLVIGNVVGLDAKQRQLHFDDRPPLSYDVLSIGVGSVPTTLGVDIHPPALLPIKPMQTLLTRLSSRLSRLPAEVSEQPLRVAVVGGGAGGVEIAFCLPHQIRQQRPKQTIEMHVFHGGPRLVPGMIDSTSDKVAATLKEQGVRVHLERRVTQVTHEGVTLEDGEHYEMDLVLWATSADPPPLLERFDLPKDSLGFLLIKETLQSTGDKRVFAVGDTGTIENISRPKSGVFAVRQGPVLYQNLGHVLAGRQPIPFLPQRDFLKLLNTGDGRAIGEYKHRTFESAWAWRLKNFIDSRFMDKYQDYAVRSMTATASKETAPEMRCLGCGGKVSQTVLSRVLAKLELPQRKEVVVGLDQPDDAAVLQLPSEGQIAVTTDFFAAPLDDPFVVGRLAALNALSDAWAMGAKPVAALTIATIPVGSPRKQEDLLTELMSGALQEFRTANTALVGGHTIEGPRVNIGFTVVAEQNTPAPWTKERLNAGDHLILTRPLGSGVLLAALMQAACTGDWYQSLLEHLVVSNEQAAEVAAAQGLTGVTDVTGFGLVGHLMEMLRPAELSATIELHSLPVLPGAVELVEQGIESTLAPENRAVESQLVDAPKPSDQDRRVRSRYALLFDPQTNGGLLLAVPDANLSAVLDDLPDTAAVIGRVEERTSNESQVRIVV